jgi:hypothetical protein
MNLIDDFARHGKGGPVIAVKNTPSGKAVEVVTTLDAASGTKGNRTCGAACHGVIMLFLSLDVDAELEDTVPGVV